MRRCKETDKVNGTLQLQAGHVSGVTTCSVCPDIAREMAPAAAVAINEAVARVLRGEVHPSARRWQTMKMATDNSSPVQSHWCPTPEDSAHAPSTLLSDTAQRNAGLPSRGCSANYYDRPSEPRSCDNTSSFPERSHQVITSSGSKQPVYFASDLQIHVQWAGPQIPEGKLVVRNLNCSPVSAHSSIIPCFGNCENNGQYENVTTEKQQITNKLDNNFNHKTGIKDNNMLSTIKKSEILEKIKTLNRKLSNCVGSKILCESDATKTTVKSPEVSTKQTNGIQEFYPNTRENISPDDDQINAVRRYTDIKTSEKNNIKECDSQPKEIFRIQSNGTKKKESFRREDYSYLEIPVKLKADKGEEYAVRSEKLFGNENHSSTILPKELSTQFNVYCGCHTSNIKSRGNQVDLQTTKYIAPRKICSCHRDIANEKSQNQCCICNNTDCLNSKCNAHRAKGGSNGITSHDERVNKNCHSGKENMRIFQVSSENKHKSTALGVPTEHRMEVNDMHKAANHSSLLEALRNQKWEQATTKDLIISASSMGRGIRKKGELLNSMIKITPNMNISRSLAMEICTLITKIRKVVPDQKYCPFLIKNINLTEKHFNDFISKHKARFLNDSPKLTASNSRVSGQSAKKYKHEARFLNDSPKLTASNSRVSGQSAKKYKHEARFLNDSPKLTASNSRVSGQSAKKYKHESYRFVPKILRNKANILPSAYCAMESDHTPSAHSTLMMPQQQGECIVMSFGKGDKAKEIISRSKWNTDASTVSHDVIDEKRTLLTLPQFEINVKSASACLEINYRRNNQTPTQKSSKVLEDTRCSIAGMRNYKDRVSEDLNRHDTKTRTMSTENISNSGEGNCNGTCSGKMQCKNTVFKPLSSMKSCHLNKQKRKYYPLKGEAGLVRTPRKILGTSSSHFCRLFYLCSLREALRSSDPEKKLHLCTSTKKFVKSQSEPALGPCLTQLPADCRSDSRFLYNLIGQKKPATLEAGQIMELTSKAAAVWSSGDTSSKEHDSLDLLSRSNKSSDESKSTGPRGKFIDSLKLAERKQDFLRKSNEKRFMHPKGQTNEKHLSQSDLFAQLENVVRSDKEGAKEILEVPSKQNFSVIVHPLLNSCVSVYDCTMQEQELAYRTKPDKGLGETNSRNDSNKQSFDRQAFSKITAADNKKEEKSDCWLNDDEIEVSSDQSRSPKDSVSLISVEKGFVFTAQTTDVVIFEGESTCMNDTVVLTNGKERLNNELISMTNEESKVTEKETKCVHKRNLQDRSNTSSMLNQTTRLEAHNFRPSNADEMGNYVTEASNGKNNHHREKNLNHVQNSQTAYEIVHELLLNILVSIHVTYLNVALKSSDHSAMNAESVDTENVFNEKRSLLCKEDIDNREEEKHNRKGAVKKMLELYLGGNASSECSDLEAERQARSSEIRTLPRGMVRERREMFAKMKLVQACSDSERSTKGIFRTSPCEPSVHAPSVQCDRQVTVVQHAPVAVVPPVCAEARSHCGEVSLTYNMEKPASDENTLSMPTLLLVLLLFLVVQISYHLLSDH